MAAHASVLARRIPWTEEPGGLRSRGPQRVGHDKCLSKHACIISAELGDYSQTTCVSKRQPGSLLTLLLPLLPPLQGDSPSLLPTLCLVWYFVK